MNGPSRQFGELCCRVIYSDVLNMQSGMLCFASLFSSISDSKQYTHDQINYKRCYHVCIRV